MTGREENAEENADDLVPEWVEVWEPTTIRQLPDLTIIRVSVPPPWWPWQGNRAERRRKQRRSMRGG